MAVASEMVFSAIMICAFIISGEAAVVSLNGKWTVSNGNISVEGNVPGCEHMALLNAKKISDPLYRFNNDEYRWIRLSNWTFSRTFNVTKSEVGMSNVVLVAEGLDTRATVSINGREVGKAMNMFIRYVFDIKSVLKEGENDITIKFESALRYVNDTAQKYPYVVPPTSYPPDEHREDMVNLIRKEQASFGWDFAPAFAPQGIWKNIFIESWNCAVLRDVSALAMKSPTNPKLWILNVTAYVNVANNPKVKGKAVDLIVSVPELGREHGRSLFITPGKHEAVNVVVNAKEAKTWWPNGYGAQPLYGVTVELVCPAFGEKSTRNFKVGFRTVELVQEPLPKENSTGLSFYFKINDRPIFLKGSNWIPGDVFQERVTTDVLENKLHSAAEANMNVLRVWGGGIYEQDEFYEITDRLGIMIWQDFMFACALYPTNEEFLDSVKQEVTQQVKRLSSHPSIIVWSGNNENEIGLAGGWYESVVSKNRTLYYDDYKKLYIETMMPIVEKLDTTRPFLASSPTNGAESEAEGWIAKNPQDPQYGDVHNYNYYADCWDVTTFPKPRFSSEFGFQSWPSFESVRKISEKEDWKYWSKFSEYRNHHPVGAIEMAFLTALHFKLPLTTNSTEMFSDMIYLTQITQALCIKSESEYFRSLQSSLDEQGLGRTMGALYWQLNDMWQAPTWASTEYDGKWKMLHYYAKRFFSQTVVVSYVIHGTLHVFGISDSTTDRQKVVLKPTLWQWDSFKPLYVWNNTFVYNQTAQSSVEIFSKNLTQFLAEGKCLDPTKCFLTFELLQDDTAISPVNTLFLTGFNKAQGIQKVNITVTQVKQHGDKIFDIELKTDGITTFTWLEALGIAGRFSDNGFLMTTPSTTISFYAWQKTTATDLQKSLTVKTYNNMNQ
ncbi:beta-mannosidase-like [Ptychodera flava]|uniref:beta-mannosidase-like n=1 Tax=Ptychodera flava TaxID=63121 RepID=UPI00396A14E5